MQYTKAQINSNIRRALENGRSNDDALIYTDGYAPPPTIPANMHTPLCWVLRSGRELEMHEEWMRKSGKVCVIENP